VSYFNNPPNTDMFGKLRVSQPSTLFDSKLLRDANTFQWDDVQVSGTAFSSYNANQASVTLATSAAIGRRVRQTKRRFSYQPGKCLEQNEWVPLADGSRQRAKDLVGKEFSLLSLNDEGEVNSFPAKASVNAFEEVFELTLTNGDKIIRNAQHPLWVTNKVYATEDGKYKGGAKATIPSGEWKELQDISPGDLVATLHSSPFRGTETADPNWVKALAYLIGDGNLTQSSTRFSRASGPALDEFVACGNALGSKINSRVYGNKTAWTASATAEKFLPQECFTWNNETLALFFSRLYATDGWAHRKEIGYCSISRQLVQDIHDLLLRFDIRSVIRSKKVKGYENYTAYTVDIYETESVLRFSEKIGIFSKEEALKKVVENTSFAKISTNAYRRKSLPAECLRWSEVKSVSSLGFSTTIAIEVPGPHTYLTNFYEHNSHAILMTGILAVNGGVANSYTLCGMVDDKNGLYFKRNSTGVYVGRRTFTSGTAVDTEVIQSAWNIDKLDGTGISGYTLDTTKTLIYSIEFEWLGVGSVKFGVIIDGQLCPCHQMNHSNVLTTVYMSTPNLPLRWEVNSTSAATNSCTAICATVISEGGNQETGQTFVVDRGVTPLITLSSTSLFPLLAVRLASTSLDNCPVLQGISIAGGTSTIFRWTLLLNPTVTGTAFSFSALAGSGMEIDVARLNTTTVSGGIEVASGYATSGTVSVFTTNTFASLQLLGSTVAGVSDVLVLAVQRITGTTESFYAAMQFREL